MNCPNCGKGFNPKSVNQRYCSAKCGNQYRRKYGVERVSITFRCAQCGHRVVTDPNRRDRRTRFCCAECEKKYWRHPPHEQKGYNQNYRSLSEMESWERRTNT